MTTGATELILRVPFSQVNGHGPGERQVIRGQLAKDVIGGEGPATGNRDRATQQKEPRLVDGKQIGQPVGPRRPQMLDIAVAGQLLRRGQQNVPLVIHDHVIRGLRRAFMGVGVIEMVGCNVLNHGNRPFFVSVAGLARKMPTASGPLDFLHQWPHYTTSPGQTKSRPSTERRPVGTALGRCGRCL